MVSRPAAKNTPTREFWPSYAAATTRARNANLRKAANVRQSAAQVRQMVRELGEKYPSLAPAAREFLADWAEVELAAKAFSKRATETILGTTKKETNDS